MNDFLIDKPLEEKYQSEVLTDNFLQEIYSTIKDIQYNSYETAKDELLALQTLVAEYLSYKNNNKNLDLSLINQGAEFTKRLEEIEEKVSQKQKAYKIKNVLRIIDKLIAGEKVTFSKPATKGINVNPNYELIKQHNLRYTFWSYIYKFKGTNWISGLTFTILNPFLALSTNNLFLTTLLNSLFCYLIPSFIIGKQKLNKELRTMEAYIAEHKGYVKEQNTFSSILKTDYERDRDKRLEEIKTNFKNKKVDSILKLIPIKIVNET